LKGKYRLSAALDWSSASVRLVVTPSPLAKEMFFCVQDVGHLYTLPRYYTVRENLDSYLVVYTLNGTGELKYMGKKYELKRGQAFFIDCRREQEYRTDPNDLWELLYVHFHGLSSRMYYEQFARHGHVVVSFEPGDTAVPDAILKLVELYRKPVNEQTEALGSKYITDILTALLLRSPLRGSGRGVIPDYIARTAEALENRYAEPLSLDTLAADANVSKFHLAKTFKKYYGYAPYEYLILIRLNAAKSLLKFTDLPVAAVAESVGFSDPSYFIRLFRQREKTTPLQYRKEWRGR